MNKKECVFFWRDFPCASHHHVVVIRRGSEGEPQVDFVYYSLFLLLSFSLPIVNPLQPPAHLLEVHYAELAQECLCAHVGALH